MFAVTWAGHLVWALDDKKESKKFKMHFLNAKSFCRHSLTESKNFVASS
jgi:hypothetical protein